MKTVFDILGDASGRLRFLVIGGHAMQAYGVVRQTLDMDCLAVDEEMPFLRKLFVRAGYSEVAGTNNFARFHHKSPYLMDVDVLLVDASTFEKLYQKSGKYRQDRNELRIPALSHLIALKLHAIKNAPNREGRDLADILELLRRNPSALSERELADLCKKFGPNGFIKKLKIDYD
jgi:hypothetical protein